MKELKHKHAGDLGFDFFASQFEGFEKYSFLQATPEQDMYKGIDGFIVNVSDQKHVANIDVKNTQDLYFLNIDPTSRKMTVRHPLKRTSETSHLAVVSTTMQKFLGFYNRKEWLSHFVKEDAIDTFLDELHSLDGLTYDKILGTTQSFSQACYKLKMTLIPYLKNNCYISYEEPKDSETQISFRIYSSEKHYSAVQLTENLIDDINLVKEKPVVVDHPNGAQYKQHEKFHSITV